VHRASGFFFGLSTPLFLFGSATSLFLAISTSEGALPRNGLPGGKRSDIDSEDLIHFGSAPLFLLGSATSYPDLWCAIRPP
jgi:hypothetical protein